MENYSYNSSSVHSPRSREIDFDNTPPWEDTQGNQNYKVKFMCSYGGKIHPRPHDNKMSYLGGETKILAVDRSVKFGVMLSKMIALCDCDAISFKYQLPGEDLEALISVTNDDDLEHMMHEYDRLCRMSPKPARLRIFVFQLIQTPSNRSFGSDEARTDKERFVHAPNLTAPQPSVTQMQPPVSGVDLLFGFEKSNAVAAALPAHQSIVGRVQEFEDPIIMDERLNRSDPIQKHIQDLQRLKMEEQQGFYRRKNDDYVFVSTGGSSGDDNNRLTEKISQVPVPGGIPYWTDKKVPGGVFPASNPGNEQSFSLVPAPAGAYHASAPFLRPMTVNGVPTPGCYTVQRTAAEAYRDQQQVYNMVPQPSMAAEIQALPPQKVAGYSEGYGMVRPATTGGIGTIAEAGYAQVAYDDGAGGTVVYAAPRGVMGQPAIHQGLGAALSSDVRAATEAGGKAAAKATQASV